MMRENETKNHRAAWAVGDQNKILSSPGTDPSSSFSALITVEKSVIIIVFFVSILRKLEKKHTHLCLNCKEECIYTYIHILILLCFSLRILER